MSSPNFPTIDRRAFLGGLGLSAIAVPLAAEAQQAGKVYRIGVLHSAARESERIKALEEGLRELGYVEGRNLVIEHRFADVKLERLGELATDLVRLKVDVIVTAINPTTLAAKQATRTIPIVMTTGVDPVAAGLVASLARPGGNVTGLTFDVDPEAIAAKRLELLKELAPRASRMAAIWNPTYAPNTPRMKGIEDAARKLGVTLVSVLVREPGDFDGWCPEWCGNREMAHSSGGKSNHQPAVRQDGRRRNAPWRSVSRSRSGCLRIGRPRWAS